MCTCQCHCWCSMDSIDGYNVMVMSKWKGQIRREIVEGVGEGYYRWCKIYYANKDEINLRAKAIFESLLQHQIVQNKSFN
jgi:hypothetical protein